MTPPFEVRAADDTDLEFLWELRDAALGSHIARITGTYDRVAERALFDEKTRVEHQLIVEVDGRPVGGVCAIDRPDELRIPRVFVHPEFQNQGIGTRLVRDLIRRARARGVRARLRVLKGNPAQRLYEREGFVVLREIDQHLEMIYPATRDTGR